MIYLDNNATTMVSREVGKIISSFLHDTYANPSSLHRFGKDARRAVEEARALVARLLGANSEREILFTSCGTESNNTAIRSALQSYPEKRRIVTTQVEHSSIRNLCQALQKEGYEIISVGVMSSGAINWDELANALTEDAAIVSIMWANNETGVLFPIENYQKHNDEEYL